MKLKHLIAVIVLIAVCGLLAFAENKPEQNDISKISTVELKAFAFDITGQIQYLQKNLELILQELSKRATPPIKEVVKDKKK